MAQDYTAARENIPILSILLNNHAMAIELPVMPVATEKYRATDISGDYAAFARSLGLSDMSVAWVAHLGGFVAGPARFIELIENRARPYIFTTAPTPVMTPHPTRHARSSGTSSGNALPMTQFMAPVAKRRMRSSSMETKKRPW